MNSTEIKINKIMHIQVFNKVRTQLNTEVLGRVESPVRHRLMNKILDIIYSLEKTVRESSRKLIKL